MQLEATLVGEGADDAAFEERLRVLRARSEASQQVLISQ